MMSERKSSHSTPTWMMVKKNPAWAWWTLFNLLINDLKINFYACVVFGKGRNAILSGVTFSNCSLVSQRNSKHFTSSLSDSDLITWQRRRMTLEKRLAAQSKDWHKHKTPPSRCSSQGMSGMSTTPKCRKPFNKYLSRRLIVIGGARASVLRESYQASDLEPVSLGSARPLQTPCWHCQPASGKQNTSWGREKTSA